MSLHIISLEHTVPTPWKNGGGVARDLLFWPAAEHWQLRVSVADIARDGPFSDYAGVARWFSVIDGAGVTLVWPSVQKRLEPATPPLHFDGGDAPMCQLLGGTTSALNLMVRADAGTASLAIATPGAAQMSAARWRGLYVADAARLQIDDTDAATVPAGTLLWSDAAAQQRWRVWPLDAAAARAWWLKGHVTPGAHR